MNVETIYKEKEGADLKIHPNRELEKYFQNFDDIIELCNSAEDYMNMHYLGYNLHRKKFDSNDLKIFQDLKKKYLL